MDILVFHGGPADGKVLAVQPPPPPTFEFPPAHPDEGPFRYSREGDHREDYRWHYHFEEAS